MEGIMPEKNPQELDGENGTLPFELPTEQQMQAMDDVLDRFKKATPAKPYFMSVFSDPQYQHTHRTRQNWLANTPFDLEEDGNAQYQTLLWRDPLETLFCLESTDSMEARYGATSNTNSAHASQSSTPLPNQNAKKKISLAAYQSKKQTGGGTQASSTKDVTTHPVAQATPDLKAEDQSDAAPSPTSRGTKRSYDEVFKQEPMNGTLNFSVDSTDNVPISPKRLKAHNVLKHEQKSTERKISPEGALKPTTLDDSRDKEDAKPLAQPSLNEGRKEISPTVDPMFLSTQSSTAASQRSTGPKRVPAWFLPRHNHSTDSLINKTTNNPSDAANGILPPSDDTNPAHSTKNNDLSSNTSSLKTKTLKSESQNSIESNKIGLKNQNTDQDSNHLVSTDDKKKSELKIHHSAAELESKNARKLSASVGDEKHPSTPSYIKSTNKSQQTSGMNVDKSTAPSTSKTGVRHVKSNSTSSFFESLKPNTSTSNPRISPNSTEQSAQSKVLRLKYGRHKKKDVERILQMKAIPATPAGLSKGDIQSNENVESRPQKVSTSLPKSQGNKNVNSDNNRMSGKRSHPEGLRGDEPLTKKVKATGEGAHNSSPRTPSLVDARSPASMTPSTLQTRDTKTARQNAAATAKSTDYDSVPKASSPPDKSISSEAWKSEQARLRNLGRSVKKSFVEMCEIAEKEQDERQKTRYKKQAAVLGMESVLCFMQAFSASDQYYTARKDSLSHWKSIVPYSNQVSTTCKEYPHLYGMSILLRAAVSSKILALYGKMKAKELEDSEDKTEPLDDVLRELAASRQLAVASNSHLPRKIVANEYPKTYEAANELPFGIITRPILAIRMCNAFLDEWTSQQDVTWTKQLDEGLCSHL